MNNSKIENRLMEQKLNEELEADDQHVSQPNANTNVSSRLSFYKQPFREAEGCGWVYDVDSNFVFQFESEFDEKGNYAKGVLEMQKKVINSLNSHKHSPISDLNLEMDKDDPNFIRNNGRLFIVIRGWGNLTGVGAHNLSGEEAANIQDNFRDWLIRKLSVNGC